jgi:hypothetical protein
MVLVLRKHASLGASSQTDPPESWSLAGCPASCTDPLLLSLSGSSLSRIATMLGEIWSRGILRNLRRIPRTGSDWVHAEEVHGVDLLQR